MSSIEDETSNGSKEPAPTGPTPQDEADEKGVSPKKESDVLDPTLPLNWSARKKFFNMGIPSLLCLVVTIGTSIYTPAVPDVMLDFGVSETVAIVPLTTYTLGLSFGPMLSAPVSEMMGRLGTYRITPPLAALFSLGAGFSPSITALCILRFFVGFFGGASLPVSAGTSADLFRVESRGVAGTFMLYPPFLGPALGPLIGGFVTQHRHLFATATGWKWSQWAFAVITIASYVPVFFLEETYLKIILARRAKKDEEQNAAPDAPKPPASRLLLIVVFITLLRPMKMLLTEPIVTFICLYVAFNFAVLFTFFASVPYVYTLVYHFDRGNTGLVFLGVGLGCTLAIPTVILLDKFVYQKAWRKAESEGQTGAVAPEPRLWAAMISAFGIPVGLFWFGWAARSDVHWIVSILGMVPFAWGNLCVFISLCLYLIDTYEALTAASAIAASSLLRYLLGSTFPLFTITMYERLGIGWATSVMAFLSVCMIPIPWVLYRWGPKIRAASSFETIRPG